MSEEIQAAIESSIEGLDGGGEDSTAVSSSEHPPSAAVTPEGTPPPSTPSAPPAPVPVQEAVPPKVRRGPIPYDRHESAIQSARAEERANHEKALAALKAEHEQSILPLRQQLQLLEIADKEPDRFLDALVAADPRYKQLLTARVNGGNGHAPAGDGMPEPDATLPDGSAGYTQEGLKRLLDWHGQQTEARLQKIYAPVLQAHQTQEAIRGAHERVSAQVQRAAASWPEFTEHQGDIAKALRADRTLSLHDAYIQVVVPKLAGRANEARSGVIAELSAKPKVVSATTPAGAPPPVASSDDLQSIIRASIANIPRS